MKVGRKIEWLVIVYDNAINQRMAFRAQHLAEVPEKIERGIVTSAGPIFKDASKTEFVGSSFTIQAESRAAVLDILKEDIYAQKNVWNMNDVIIHPFQPFYRAPHAVPCEK